MHTDNRKAMSVSLCRNHPWLLKSLDYDSNIYFFFGASFFGASFFLAIDVHLLPVIALKR
jgi:hypothetical protein